jgi:hypothetical protein
LAIALLLVVVALWHFYKLYWYKLPRITSAAQPQQPQANLTSIIEDKERQYLSWFMKVLTHNPSEFSEEDIDAFASYTKVPGGLRG